ncbi:flagellar biosynthesis protein FlgL [Vibrio algivorus]|uniref:Flagellar biosynthesis protein FlgL n=1 Tax=Vibrio algivorus TaxID=1667024 RepID=A0A557P2S6_9VIBR|nr:flagellar biosynthesis protein FlgL [Vibrio algivorus]TVO34929.1 flagellar biosynthesis protein FlgL [Vibrio algivorus]
MRVADSQFNIMLNLAMMKNNGEINKVVEQMSSGNVINHLSDDPSKMVKLEGLDKIISANQQYQSNIDSVHSKYEEYETYMTTLNDISLEVNDLLLQGKNGTLDVESSKGIVTELELLREQALDIVNKKSDGTYLFSGTAVDKPSLTYDEATGEYTFSGNNNHRETKVNETELVQSNFTAEEMIGDASFFTSLDAAIEELKNPTNNFDVTMTTALDTGETFRTNVNASISVLGSNYSSLERLQQNNSDVELFATKVQTDVNALDYAEASMRLNMSLSTMQAMQTTYMTVNNNPSLFDLM